MSSAATHKATTHKGSCHCGSVTYTVKDLSDIWYCHCNQCRHLTGHFMSAAGALNEDLVIDGPVTWREITEKSSSGHCTDCGSYLFWKGTDYETTSIVTGNLESTKGLEVKGHIFVESKGDYYEITDGLPQFDTYPERDKLRG